MHLAWAILKQSSDCSQCAYRIPYFEFKELACTSVKELPEKKLLVRICFSLALSLFSSRNRQIRTRGRMILPQQMMIRDVLDGGCMAFCNKETELKATCRRFKIRPALHHHR